jgi:hypothetical protein
VLSRPLKSNTLQIIIKIAMSGPLVPSGQSGPSFAQQGSVDWVALSGSTLNFSVEVVSRFSKAGVEMITVAMGQALFSGFKIPPARQKRLSDAVAKLKAFSSHGNVLWFGFGINILRQLSARQTKVLHAREFALVCRCPMTLSLQVKFSKPLQMLLWHQTL